MWFRTPCSVHSRTMHYTLPYVGLDVWRAEDDPMQWLWSEAVLIYKKGDSECPGSYRPLSVTNSMYCMTTKLYWPYLHRLVHQVVNSEQDGCRPLHTVTEKVANPVNCLHEIQVEEGEPTVVLLDVANLFGPQSMKSYSPS